MPSAPTTDRCPSGASLLALGAALFACALPAMGQTSEPQIVAQPNVLVIVADDLGVDILSAYALGTSLPHTPTLDELAANGVTFERAYASPACTPTRANIQTGRYNFRTGVGSVLQPWTTTSLNIDEVAIPEMLDLGTNNLYTTGAFGKWHLSTKFSGGETSPNDFGYDRFDGSLYNLYHDGSDNYYAWKRVTDGDISYSSTYTTSAMVNVTRNFIKDTPEPWFAYLPFHTPHTPYHVPPEHLFQVDVTGADPETNPRPLYEAMVEAMDKEMGRLFKSIPPDVLARTTVIFIGDNGTPNDVTLPPFVKGHAKGTTFEGGVQVPLIISGANVTDQGGRNTEFAHAVDIFTTIADLAGVDLATTLPGTTIDGVSLVPTFSDATATLPRTHAFSQIFYPNTGTASDYCHLDLGYASQEGLSLTVCGPHLYPGSGPAIAHISGAAPNAPMVLFPSLLFAPNTSILGNTLIVPASPWLGVVPFLSDSAGEWTAPIPGELAPLINPYTLFLQAIVETDLGTWEATNAVALAFEEEPSASTMLRGDRYKLIRKTVFDAGTTLAVDSLYDLELDPFELNDLLVNGVTFLTANEAQAYSRLELELAALLASS